MGVGPITAAEFYAAVQKLWRPHVPSRGPFAKAKIGLCVSGGPDSMALAYLCSRLRAEDITPELDATAFIVDHKVRPESTDEAYMVSKWLENLGMKSEILTMDWGPERSLTFPSAFETKARLKRHSIIAEACQRNAIHSTFLGHHADDQVETVLMRMVSYLGSFAGLQGIAPVTPIPCSDSVYKADPRGPPIPLYKSIPNQTTNSPPWRREPVKSLQQYPASSAYPQGILMFRPFLNYSKPQLLATCKSNGIPFVSDPSNADPSITIRNTIRLLNSRHTLPRALRPQSIINLAEKARVYDEDLTRKSQSVLEEAQISFDMRSGLLDVRFPLSISSRIDVMARALQRLLEVVAPFKPEQMGSRLALTRLCRIATSMFPQLNKEQEKMAGPGSSPFHIDHVKIDKTNHRGSIPACSTDNHKRCLSDITWHISRMPPERSRPLETSRSFVPDWKTGKYKGSEWLLWEGRYWIKLVNIASSELADWHIRLLRVEDMRQIREAFIQVHGKPALDHFNAILNVAAPGKVRYGLPVIVDDQNRVRFIPTLGVTVPISKPPRGPGRKYQIDFRISYKPIEPFLLSKMTLSSFDTTVHKNLENYAGMKQRAKSLIPSLRQAKGAIKDQ